MSFAITDKWKNAGGLEKFHESIPHAGQKFSAEIRPGEKSFHAAASPTRSARARCDAEAYCRSSENRSRGFKGNPTIAGGACKVERDKAPAVRCGAQSFGSRSERAGVVGKIS